MIRTITLSLSLALAACTTTATPKPMAGHQPAEEEVILAVMDAYMHEISANDLAAIANAFGVSLGMINNFGIGRPARPQSSWTMAYNSGASWRVASAARYILRTILSEYQ